MRPVVSLQSDAPVTAAGTALNTPSPTSTRAASRYRRGPMMSSTHALVQNPIGRSVSIGCNGCPSHVPLRRSFSGPSGTTRCTTRRAVRLGSSSRVPARRARLPRAARFPRTTGSERVPDDPPCARSTPDPRRRHAAPRRTPRADVPVPIRAPRTKGDAVREIPLDGDHDRGCARRGADRPRPGTASPAGMDATAASRRPHAGDGRDDRRGADRAHDDGDRNRARRARRRCSSSPAPARDPRCSSFSSTGWS